MALKTKIVCLSCKQEKYVVTNPLQPERVCDDCENLSETTEREEYFNRLEQLPLIDRVRKIEEFIYNFNKNKRNASKILDNF